MPVQNDIPNHYQNWKHRTLDNSEYHYRSEGRPVRRQAKHAKHLAKQGGFELVSRTGGKLQGRVAGAISDKIIHTGGKVKKALSRRKKSMNHDHVDEGLASAALQAGKAIVKSRAAQRVATSKVGVMAKGARSAYKRNPAAFRRLAKMKVGGAGRKISRQLRVAKVAVKRSAPGMKFRGAKRKAMGTLNARKVASSAKRQALRTSNPVRAGVNDTTRAIRNDIATGVATNVGVNVAMHHVNKKMPQESISEVVRNYLWETDSDFSPAQMGSAMKKYKASGRTMGKAAGKYKANNKPSVKSKTQFGDHHLDNAHVAHMRSGVVSSKSPAKTAFKLNQKTKTNLSASVIDIADTIYEDQIQEWVPLAVGAARMIGSSIATDAVIKGGSKVVKKLKKVRTEGWDSFPLPKKLGGDAFTTKHKTLGKPQRAMGGVKAGLAVGGAILAGKYAGKKLAGSIMKRSAITAKNAEKAHSGNVKRISKKIKSNPNQTLRNRFRMNRLKSSAKKRDYATQQHGKAVKRDDRKAAHAQRKNNKLKKRLAKVTG